MAQKQPSDLGQAIERLFSEHFMATGSLKFETTVSLANMLSADVADVEHVLWWLYARSVVTMQNRGPRKYWTLSPDKHLTLWFEKLAEEVEPGL